MYERVVLQKLLNKIAVKRFMDNLNNYLFDKSITNIEVSRRAGKPENAFNKTINEAEDPRLSTFLRYYTAVIDALDSREEPADIELINLLDEQIIKIFKLSREAQEADIKDLIISQKKLFRGLKVYVDILHQRKALTESEVNMYKNIEKLLKTLEERHE